VSFAQARTLVRKYIAGLRHLGVKPGDCVCIHSFNDIHYILLALGIIGTGGIFAGTNPAYTPLELTHHLKTTATKFIISEPELLPQIKTSAQSLGIPDSRIVVFHPLSSQQCPAGMTSYTSLLEHGESDWVRFGNSEQSKTTTACRFTSSGTTGLPKACINTHFNLVAQHELNYRPEYYRKPYEVINLWTLPFFHAAVGPKALFSCFKQGETAYIMRRFELETFLRNIQKYQVTELYSVPPIAVAMMMSPLVQSGEVSLRSIRAGLVGAAPLTKESQERIKSYFHKDASYNQVWGEPNSDRGLTT
jgi:acyl-CoA synthetase (AMP-forming)/AMP-acid ligase II